MYKFNIRIWSPIVSGNARKQLASLVYECATEEEAQAMGEKLAMLVQGPVGKIEALLPWSEEWKKGKAEGRFQEKGRQKRGTVGTEFVKW